MIKNTLYAQFHDKELTVDDKKFQLEFDEERRCFRLYQKSRIGMQNIGPETQAEFAAALNENNYLERINRPLPYHSYLLLDGRSLQALLVAKKLTGIPKDLLNELAEKERREELVLEDEELDRKSVGRRVWVDKDNNYRTCIDNERNMFIATEGPKVGQVVDFNHSNDSIEAFKSYLSGEAYLRRKEELTVPITPVWLGRKFAKIKPSSTDRDSSVKGFDDMMLGFASAKLPHQAPAVAQSLAIFPVFLLAVRAGVDNIKKETQETIEELEKLEQEINECEKTIHHFMTSEEFSQESAMKCFRAIKKLHKSLHELPNAKIEAISSSTLAYPAMTAMFGAVMMYQANAFLSMCGGADSLTKGIGEISFTGIDSSTYALANYGGLSVAGNASLFAGEAVMTVFLIAKVAAQFREYSAQKKEMGEIGNSEEISALAKDIILKIKGDENFYNMMQIIGNGTLAAGQALMATTGPIALGINPALYAGLGLSVAGILTTVSAELVKDARHSFDKQTSELENEISQHYVQKLVKLVCETSANESSTDDLEPVFSEILRHQAFTNELFFHLTCTNLATHKILKEGSKDGDFMKAIKATKSHYNAHEHQEYLGQLVEIVHNDPLSPLAMAMHRARNAGEFAYQLMHEQLISLLVVKNEDRNWMIELGEKLSIFEANPDNELLRDMSEIEGLPTEIAETLDNLYRSLARRADYGDVILQIQDGFMRNRLHPDNVLHILEDIEKKTEAEREADLRKLLLESEVSSTFVIEAAQEKYIKENRLKTSGAKKKGEYAKDRESQISIVGKVRKFGGGLLSFSHKKNVYKVDPQKLSAVSPKVVDAGLKMQKYQQRSLGYRLLGAVAEAGTVLGQTAQSMTKEMREKKPGVNLHSPAISTSDIKIEVDPSLASQPHVRAEIERRQHHENSNDPIRS
jgi:hypothetical protein